MASREFEATADIAALLGGKKVFKRAIAERREMREVVRSGLPFGALNAFTNTTGIPTAAITRVLGLAPRTLARRKDKHVFNLVESDRLYRLARVTCMTIQVLGSQENAREWLARPNRALGSETPLSFLDTDIGARQVEAVLGRIDHGVFS